MPESNSDAIRHALEIARSRGYTEVEISAAGTSFSGTLSASSFASRTSVPTSDNLEGPSGPGTSEITATLVGYYQPAPTPLAIGQKVSRGDVVAIITALGLANEVEAS